VYNVLPIHLGSQEARLSPPQAHRPSLMPAALGSGYSAGIGPGCNQGKILGLAQQSAFGFPPHCHCTTIFHCVILAFSCHEIQLKTRLPLTIDMAQNISMLNMTICLFNHFHLIARGNVSQVQPACTFQFYIGIDSAIISVIISIMF
jgi:hypothetical protein